jgi:acetyl-CoA acetyltransferase
VLRAAMAIESGVCETCLLLFPSPKRPSREAADRKIVFPIYGAGGAWGAWQSLHEYPSGLVGAVANFAMLARFYLSEHGLDEESLASIASVSRRNAQGNTVAVFGDRPMSLDDVMAAPRICDPIKLPEAVIPTYGGGGLLITTAERARRSARRPVLVAGYGEKLNLTTMQYARDPLSTPLDAATRAAMSRAGVTHKAIDFAGIYDCFTVNVALSLENAGFCAPGQGTSFFTSGAAHWDGAFPINPNGGMLGAGQAGTAGGASHVSDSVLQIQRRPYGVQIAKAERAFVAGTGGMMSEQVALVLEGA